MHFFPPLVLIFSVIRMAENSSNEEIMKVLYQIRYPLYISYIAFGAPAVLTNLAILAILLSDIKLLSKSAMIAGLAGGNLFNGLHAFGYGVYRMPLILANKLDLPATNWACMASLLPTCLLLGNAIPALMQLTIGFERLMALAAFNFYRVNWSSRKSWFAVGVIYLVIIFGWVIPPWYDVLSKYRLVTKECSSGMVFSRVVTNTLFRFVTATSTLGTICIFTAVIIGVCRHRKLLSTAASQADVAQFGRQLQASKMMMMIAVFELCFVVVPNFLIVLVTLGIPLPPKLTVYATSVYCISSSTNIFVYFVMNSNFRRVALSRMKSLIRFCFLCKGASASNQVVPADVYVSTRVPNS